MPNVIFIIASLWLLSRVDKMWLFPRKNGNKKSRGTNAVMILMIVFPLVVLCSTSVFAGETEALIKGKNVFFDGNTELWGIYGGISISFDETYITADQAELNMNTKIVNLIGNVTLSNEEGDFESNSAVFDLSTNELNFVEVKASIPYEDLEGRLYLGGDSFDVTSDTYRLLKGYVTTCDLDDPHYRIEAEEIEIIGSDRISLVNFSYYEGDFKLITIPEVRNSTQWRRPPASRHRVQLLRGMVREPCVQLLFRKYILWICLYGLLLAFGTGTGI